MHPSKMNHGRGVTCSNFHQDSPHRRWVKQYTYKTITNAIILICSIKYAAKANNITPLAVIIGIVD